MAQKTNPKDLAKSLSSLSINTKDAVAAPHRKTQPEEPAESWEDAADSGDESSSPPLSPAAPLKSAATQLHQSTGAPSPPPPTPASPTARTARPFYAGSTLASIDDAYDDPTSRDSSSSSALRDPDKRPEKTTSVATRLIAAGLGVRAPRRTEEQRKYDQSMREQEKKKRDDERARQSKAKEDVEKAKAAIWDD